jgi:hypothetical protein
MAREGFLQRIHFKLYESCVSARSRPSHSRPRENWPIWSSRVRRLRMRSVHFTPPAFHNQMFEGLALLPIRYVQNERVREMEFQVFLGRSCSLATTSRIHRRPSRGRASPPDSEGRASRLTAKGAHGARYLPSWALAARLAFAPWKTVPKLQRHDFGRRLSSP